MAFFNKTFLSILCAIAVSNNSMQQNFRQFLTSPKLMLTAISFVRFGYMIFNPAQCYDRVKLPKNF